MNKQELRKQYIKLRESISELYGVKKGISMPVVKFGFHNSFIFNEVRNDF